MTSTAETALPHFGDRYRVERELGRGGMATVYLCFDTQGDRKVAIKLLHTDLAAAVGSARFHREIRIASGLTHPNILPAHDSGETEHSLFYVMPFVEGESLRDRLTRERQLPVGDAVRITSEIASALQYAHAQGIVHRDIKPENILLEGERAVLADFGIARAKTGAAEAEALTQTGMSLGTPAYMSPEQAMGEKHIDGRSDQYSLACVMYEMLAGYPPFMANTMQALIAKHLGEQVPLLTTVRPSVPDELEDVVLRALEKVPADRFQSMQEFADAMNSVLSVTGTWTRRTATRAVPLKATRGYRAVQPPPATATKKWVAIGAAGLAIGLVAAGFAWFHSRNSGPGTSTGAHDPSKIAVLYFTDESKDQSLGAIADGVTESLIEQLSEIGALDVVSQNGVLQYRNGSASVDSIAKALGVGSIVTGSIAPAKAGISIDVRLLDWTGSKVDSKGSVYDDKNLLLLKNTVAERVVTFLRQRLGNDALSRKQKQETGSSDAWLAVQKAERRFKDADSLLQAGAVPSGVSALGEADSMLVSAAKFDPKWSAVPAQRSQLAYVKATALTKNPAALPAVVDSGIAFANRALALNPRDADALEFKGKLQYLKITEHLLVDQRENDRTLAAAESTLTRAVSINKNQAGAWNALGTLHYRKPDLDAVASAFLRAYEADAYLRSARSILRNLFLAHYNLEHFTEAMRYLDELKRRFPTDRYYFEGRILMYRTKLARSAAGSVDIDSAWTYYQKFVAATPEADRPFAERKERILLAGALANAKGLEDSARSVLMAARTTSAQLDPRKELPINEAAVRVMLGDKDMAVDLIREYLTVNPDHRRGFTNRVGWYWRGLENHPKFQALITGLQ